MVYYGIINDTITWQNNIIVYFIQDNIKLFDTTQLFLYNKSELWGTPDVKRYCENVWLRLASISGIQIFHEDAILNLTHQVKRANSMT